jgi:GPH family glycoside/pentoside/hexuronide:cation symporter
MSEKIIAEKNTSKSTSQWTQIAYSLGTLADNLALQNFLFLGFSFYYAVIGLPIWMVTIGYVVYSIWDAFDDPMLGVLSDRTKSKWGRRRPWIYIATIPLCILMVTLWTPPTSSNGITLFYLIIMLIIFDLFFTMYTVNFNSLWPEMFLTVKDRSSVGVWRNIFTIIGLIIAFLVPGFIIEDMTNQRGLEKTPSEFMMNGIIAAVVVFITIAIMLKWGSFERKEFSKDVETAPSWKDSLKITVKNKAFTTYAITALAVFIVYGILPLLIPFYAVFVLNMGSADSLEVSLLIFSALLVGAISTPFWAILRKKWGVRKSYMISLGYWGLTLLAFMFANDIVSGFIVIFFMGFGLGGSLYLYDQGIALVIDDDEVRSGLGIRREGSYYGVIAFFNRFSNAINLIIVGIVFTGTGWGEYTPKPGADVILGLRFLLGVWPVVVILIAIFFLYKWPIHGERLKENEKLLKELHEEKRAKL